MGAKLGANWGQTVPKTGENQLTVANYVVEKTGASTVNCGSGTKGQRFESSRASIGKIDWTKLQREAIKIMPERQRLLELALKGLEAERAKIDDEIAQIKSQLGGGRATAMREAGNAAAQPRKRRRMSASARKKISEAMKRRYATMRAAAKK